MIFRSRGVRTKPVSKVDTEGDQIGNVGSAAGQGQVSPTFTALTTQWGVIAVNVDSASSLAGWRHHVFCRILMTTDVPAVPHVTHRVGRNRAGIRHVQPPVNRQPPIRDGGGDGFLNRFIARGGGKFAESKLGMVLYSGQYLKKISLPVLVASGQSTHWKVSFG
jgi:hypothetical protein